MSSIAHVTLDIHICHVGYTSHLTMNMSHGVQLAIYAYFTWEIYCVDPDWADKNTLEMSNKHLKTHTSESEYSESA